MSYKLSRTRIDSPNTVAYLIGWSKRGRSLKKHRVSQITVKIFTPNEYPNQLLGNYSHDTHMLGLPYFTNQRIYKVFIFIKIQFTKLFFLKR